MSLVAKVNDCICSYVCGKDIVKNCREYTALLGNYIYNVSFTLTRGLARLSSHLLAVLSANALYMRHLKEAGDHVTILTALIFGDYILRTVRKGIMDDKLDNRR